MKLKVNAIAVAVTLICFAVSFGVAYWATPPPWNELDVLTKFRCSLTAYLMPSIMLGISLMVCRTLRRYDLLARCALFGGITQFILVFAMLAPELPYVGRDTITYFEKLSIPSILFMIYSYLVVVFTRPGRVDSKCTTLGLDMLSGGLIGIYLALNCVLKFDYSGSNGGLAESIRWIETLPPQIVSSVLLAGLAALALGSFALFLRLLFWSGIVLFVLSVCAALIIESRGELLVFLAYWALLPGALLTGTALLLRNHYVGSLEARTMAA